MTQMLFYENPKPLSRQYTMGCVSNKIGRDLSLPSALTRSCARASNSLRWPTNIPIVFVEGSDGWVPIALFGLNATENQWVDRAGAWRGRYIPAFISQYPFAIGRGESEVPLVCIDEASNLLSPDDGLALFEGGQPTPIR